MYIIICFLLICVTCKISIIYMVHTHVVRVFPF
uniref:Uncharacterized protein n=1 Tax=Arundo donax TaxID=35708 RepID=A0A0A9EMR0_ARUDO